MRAVELRLCPMEYVQVVGVEIDSLDSWTVGKVKSRLRVGQDQGKTRKGKHDVSETARETPFSSFSVCLPPSIWKGEEANEGRVTGREKTL